MTSLGIYVTYLTSNPKTFKSDIRRRILYNYSIPNNRILYSYTLLGRRISRFMQSRQVISDEAQSSSDIILARLYKSDIRQHNSV